MSYKLQSLAKPILVFSLLIGASSFYFGQQWAKESLSTSVKLASAKKEEAISKESLAAIESNLSEGSPASALETLVPELMLEVFNQRVRHGISLALAAPAKAGSAQMPEVSALAEPIAGSSLKSVSIKLAGTYKTYPELLAYLDTLSAKPVAISRLKVQEQSFEVSLRVFGTLSGT